mmetsp:Transcript_49689/g.116788  ORF Transcript_49689/g.116788 Transcript_49689/m.116788 type:complete len:313 (-) Transcript_49689:29-967(-)|eukprot:CAMPEP_0175836034 /NCGR_PEP_ID=MMETSP0107_2-20121207/16923_1 /TAXON_ID=195067 ORGANISM="Goniomonas pacifica, Strain CCMP1869" /NCGR_SAMPLE_ID=MMETSP0107_2 /ASSEMBLY_ACC=CAM_ASM_000203 /LENGTH=312 /DNA_ID=CAMNT_0017149393 /DNA_START=49 /DNA_END=987 /DNA_ORIENTATION=-
MRFEQLQPDIPPTRTFRFWSCENILVAAAGLSPALLLTVLLAYLTSWSKPDYPPLCPRSCNIGEENAEISWSTLWLSDLPFTYQSGGPLLDNFFLGDSVCQPPMDNETGSGTMRLQAPSFKRGDTVVMDTNCTVASAAQVQKLLPPGRELTFSLCNGDAFLYHNNCTCRATVPSSGVLVRGEFKMYGEFRGFIDWTWYLRRCEVELVSEIRPPLADGERLNITIALEALPEWPNVLAVVLTQFALYGSFGWAGVIGIVLLCMNYRHWHPVERRGLHNNGPPGEKTESFPHDCRHLHSVEPQRVPEAMQSEAL